MEKINSIIRIALIGPECTGKSSLSEALAKHYQTQWVKEYAREYLNGTNRKYTIDDILNISKKQKKKKKEFLKNSNRCASS